MRSRYLYISTLSVLVLAAVPSSVLAGACARQDSNKVISLEGNESLGSGESFFFESRIERVDDQVLRFFYCVRNGREYRPVTILWNLKKKDEVFSFFESVVPPKEVRFEFQDTLEETYTSASAAMDYDGHLRSPPPETLMRASQAGQLKTKTTLQSGGSIEIPANSRVAEALRSQKIERYSASDFLNVQIQTISTYEPQDGNTGIIRNDILVKFGDPKMAFTALMDSPIQIFEAAGDNGTFLVESVTLDGKAGLDGIVTGSKLVVEGPVEERHTLLAFGTSGESWSTIPVSYFAASSRR